MVRSENIIYIAPIIIAENNVVIYLIGRKVIIVIA